METTKQDQESEMAISARQQEGLSWRHHFLPILLFGHLSPLPMSLWCQRFSNHRAFPSPFSSIAL